ncbi:MAG: TIGR03943 family protein [Microbacterium sp.]
MRRAGALATRWLGVGLASALAVVTLSLAVTGRLGLYINPDSTWFAAGMAVLVLVGAVASFALPLGAEADHGHDHGDAHEAGASGVAPPAPRPEDAEHREHPRRHPVAIAATVAGGVAATGVVLLTLLLPPASLSADLAMSRDVGAPPLFAGTDVVALAATGDTSSFGIGEWATVFATATDPEAFDGDAVVLTGFVTPGVDFDLTRLVITHCVIDAQPASVPVATATPVPDTGQWVTVTGTVRATPDGRLEIDASSVEPIDEPQDPYEY